MKSVRVFVLLICVVFFVVHSLPFRRKRWVSVLTLEDNPYAARVKNVKHLLSLGLDVFYGSFGADVKCRALLKREGILVSPSYWRGGGKIGAGKVGHWCSVLRFLFECKRRAVSLCIFVEDDMKLSSSEVLTLKEAPLKFSRPIGRLGRPGGETITAFNASLIDVVLDQVRSRGILNPFDVMFNALGFYERVLSLGHLLDPSNKKSTSLIRTMDVLNITDFNRVLQTSPIL